MFYYLHNYIINGTINTLENHTTPYRKAKRMRESKALQALKKLHDAQNLICIAWSGGKDSSVVLDLVLRSAVRHPSPAPIVVTHADTGVENPEISTYVRQEIKSIKRYAEKHNIVVTVKIASPSLGDSWAVKVWWPCSPKFL